MFRRILTRPTERPAPEDRNALREWRIEREVREMGRIYRERDELARRMPLTGRVA